MTYLQQLHHWSSKHHQRWFIVLRILLGLSLITKGIQFIKNTAALELLLQQTSVSQHASWFNTFIPWLHLFGGSMIMAGLFTRLSALLQLPVLLGAVFFVNAKQGGIATTPDLLFSITVLLLLFFFLVEGGGPFSLDTALRKQQKAV